MRLRIVEEGRELVTVDTEQGRGPVLPSLQRVPARGEQIVLTDALTGVDRFYHIIQVQHRLGLDPQSGVTDVLGIDVQVRLVQQQSGFNPLTNGVA